MEKSLVIPTYTPLARGKFRCNTSNEVLSRSQLKSHRKRKISEQLQRINNSGNHSSKSVDLLNAGLAIPRFSEVKSASIYGFFSKKADCPYCSETNVSVKPGETVCRRCTQTFKVLA